MKQIISLLDLVGVRTDRIGNESVVAWVPTTGGTEHVYLEVKAPHGRLSDNQKRFQKRCREHNVWHFVVHSPQEALHAIEIVTDGLSHGNYEITQPRNAQDTLR